MTDTNQRVDFGVKTSVLRDASKRLVIIGTTSVKASKVAALAAMMQGAPAEDTATYTGVALATLRRVFGISKSKVASKLTARMRDIDWAALAGSDDVAPDYDAVLAASLVWDDFLKEESQSRTKDPLSATDLAILVHDSIVKADNPDVWITAVADALESAQADLAALAEADAA